jgi:hypothetical protein
MVLSQETGSSDQGIRLMPPRQQGAGAQQWRSRTPKHSPTCYLADFKLDTLPKMFSKMVNAPRRPDRQGDGLYQQKGKFEGAGPAHLRADRQSAGRVGCFQIHETRGWREMGA